MTMPMMHMPLWVLVTLILFITVVGLGAFVFVRVMGASQAKGDHPKPGAKQPASAATLDAPMPAARQEIQGGSRD
ncbi:MAG: hypothetical protein LC749_00700 [Actinobacteria bacterium]|nr:hypothetical protein [Actinomycetota bacterium]